MKNNLKISLLFLCFIINSLTMKSDWKTFTIATESTINSIGIPIIMTPLSGNMRSAIWSGQKVDISQDFKLEYSANFGIFNETTNRNGDNTGADGIVFVIQNDSRGVDAIGGLGMSLGYAQYGINTTDILPSLAIEFDDFYNVSIDDPVYDHISFVLNADLFNTLATTEIKVENNTDVDVEDKSWYCIKILWDASESTFTVYVDDQQRIVQQVLNLKTILNNGDPDNPNTEFFWGFTSATLNSYNLQQIFPKSFDQPGTTGAEIKYSNDGSTYQEIGCGKTLYRCEDDGDIYLRVDISDPTNIQSIEWTADPTCTINYLNTEHKIIRVNPSANKTIFTVVVTHTYGCTATDIITIEKLNYSIEMGNLNLCAGDVGVLTANPKLDGVDYTGDISYEWKVNGVVLPNETSNTINVTYNNVNVHRVYEVTATFNNNGIICTETKTADVYFDVYQTILTNPVKMCNDCPGKLQLDIKKKDENGNWVTGGTIQNINWAGSIDPNITETSLGSGLFQITQEGLYQVEVTLDGWSNDCIAAALIEVEKQDIEFTLTGNNLCIVNEEPQTWSISPTIDCNDNAIIFDWINITPGGLPDDGFIGPHTDVSTVEIMNIGKYRVTATNQDGCIIETIDFDVYDMSFYVEVTDLVVCDGNFSQLSVKPNDPSRYTYHWTLDDDSDASNFLDNVNVPNPNVTNLPPPGRGFKIEVTMIDEPHCYDYRYVDIIFENIQMEAHHDYAVCLGESVQLRIYLKINNQEISNYSNYHFEWSPKEGLDNPYAAEPYASPDVTTEYSVKLITENGCEISVGNINVNVIRSDNDFTKRIYFPSSQGVYIAQFQGILRENNCGILIYGRNLADCDPNGTATPQVIVSLNPNGELGSGTWIKKYPTQTQSMSDDIQITSISSMYNKVFHDLVSEKNGYIVTGKYKLTGSNWDTELFKINNDGSHISSNTTRFVFGTDSDDIPKKVLQTKLGDFAIIGNTMSSGSGDIFIVKRHNDFSSYWAKTYGTSYIEEVEDFIENDNGDLIIVGSTKYSSNIYQTLVMKVDGTNGNKIWSFTYDIPSNNYPNFGLSISKSKSNDGYYVAGNTNSFGTGSLTNGQLFKIAENGSLLWNKGKRIAHQSGAYNLTMGDIITNSINEIGCFLKLDIATNVLANINTSNFSIDFKEYTPNDPNPVYCDVNHYPESILRKDLLNLDFRGFTSASAVLCKANPGYLDYFFQELILNNTKNTTFINECYDKYTIVLPDYEVEKSETIYGQLSVNPFDFNTFTPTFLPQDHIVYISSACTIETPICYCDNNLIEVTITQNDSPEPSNKCCFNISFQINNNICNIQYAKIQGISNQLSLSSSNTFCIDEFSGNKTIIIDYYDAGDNVVCSSTRNIICKCDCEDYNKPWSQLTIEKGDVIETPENCCYPIYINNQNDCAFREPDITVLFNDNLDGDELSFTGIDGWNSVKNDFTNELMLVRGSKQINGNSYVPIGTICVKRADGPKTLTFKFNNPNCPKQWDMEFGCELNCCDHITQNGAPYLVTSSQQQDGFCCYDLSFLIKQEMENCADIKNVLIRYNGLKLWEYNTNGSLPNLPIGPYSQIICIPYSKLAGLPEQLNVVLEFVNSDGEVVCPKTATIESCYDCCEDIVVNLEGDPHAGCCWFFNFSNYYCNNIYSIKIIENQIVGFQRIQITKWEHPKESNGFGGYNPLNINLISGYFCISPQNEDWDICFYDENDNVICCKHYPKCVSWDKGSQPDINEDIDNVIIKRLYCIPNPVYDLTSIYFDLNQNADISLEVYSAIGFKIKTLEIGSKMKGINLYQMKTINFSSGLYYIILNANHQIQIIPLIIMK